MDIWTSAFLVLGLMLAMFATAAIILYFSNRSRKAEQTGGFDTEQKPQKEKRKKKARQVNKPPPPPISNADTPDPLALLTGHPDGVNQNSPAHPPAPPSTVAESGRPKPPPPASGRRPFQIEDETGNDW